MNRDGQDEQDEEKEMKQEGRHAFSFYPVYPVHPVNFFLRLKLNHYRGEPDTRLLNQPIQAGNSGFCFGRSGT
jgi:hypothetical protein